MLLYHFIGAKYGIEAIKRSRLKISQIDDLNDPFEFLGYDLKDSRFRIAANATKNDLAKNRGILCMSKSWKNPLMWAHYAERHRGLALAFECSDLIFSEVEYRNTRISSEKFSRIDADADDMKAILFSKFSHWQYEAEYRAFVSLEEKDLDSGLYFYYLDKYVRLKKVVLGFNFHCDVSEVIDAVKEAGHRNVEIFRVRPAFKTFAMVRDRSVAPHRVGTGFSPR